MATSELKRFTKYGILVRIKPEYLVKFLGVLMADLKAKNCWLPPAEPGTGSSVKGPTPRTRQAIVILPGLADWRQRRTIANATRLEGWLLSRHVSGNSRFDASLPHKCGVPKLAGTPHLCGRAPKMRIAGTKGLEAHRAGGSTRSMQ